MYWMFQRSPFIDMRLQVMNGYRLQRSYIRVRPRLSPLIPQMPRDPADNMNEQTSAHILAFYQSKERGAIAQRTVTEERRIQNAIERDLKPQFDETAAICVNEGELMLRATLRRSDPYIGIAQIRSDLLKAGFTPAQITTIDRIRTQKRVEMRLEVNLAPKRKADDAIWSVMYGE